MAHGGRSRSPAPCVQKAECRARRLLDVCLVHRRVSRAPEERHAFARSSMPLPESRYRLTFITGLLPIPPMNTVGKRDFVPVLRGRGAREGVGGDEATAVRSAVRGVMERKLGGRTDCQAALPRPPRHCCPAQPHLLQIFL